jgi:integrase/recombinase XerD
MQISTFVLQTIQMDSNVFISIYLDIRRSKANNKYPVKLRVFTKTPRKQKLYPTVFELTENEFKSIWLTQRPREEYKESRLKLQAIENKANETANKLNPFSFENFESKLYRKNGDGGNVFYQYEAIIKKLKANKQIGTASNYE